MILNYIISYDEHIKGVVYVAINQINNKFYIGMTTSSLKSRKKSHKYSAKHCSTVYFHNAINKYGFENFLWGILFISPDKTILLQKEVEFIKLFNSMDSNVGYNLSTGGEHPILSKSVIDIISEKAKVRLSNPLNNPFYGKTHTEDMKQHFSDIRKGKNCNIENPFYGKTHTEETKDHLSNIRTIWASKPENKERLSIQNQNRTLVYCPDSHIMFNSLKEAAIYFNINPNTFKVYIKRSEYVFGIRFITFNEF